MSVTRAWNRFWFEPASTVPLALLRIGFGLLMLLWALSLTLDVDALFSADGIVVDQPSVSGAWGVLGWTDWEPAPRILLALLALAALALAVGYRTRLAALIVFVAIVSFSHRNPMVGNSGDGLLRVISLFLVLAPAGAALSLDRWRSDPERFWISPKRSPWPQRLVQVQLSMLYLSTVWAKARGETWNDGTAIAFALRQDELQRLPVPDVGQWLIAANTVTYGVLAVELALGVLVWQRRLRPWVLLAGVALHLGIEWGVRVGFFSWAILVAYLAWLPGDTGDRVADWARRRLAAGGYAGARGEDEARRAPG